MPRHSSMPVREYGAIRPDNIGLHNSHAPARPGASQAPRGAVTAAPSSPPWYAKRGTYVLAAALVIAGMIAAYTTGAFQHDPSTDQAAILRDAGFDPGKFDDAEHFRDQPGNRFDGVPLERVDGLIQALKRSGARHVWAIQIETFAGSSSTRTLLVELPDDPAARRTIFWQHARGASSHPVADDTGQRYLRIVL
jgi:hypothetical protein